MMSIDEEDTDAIDDTICQVCFEGWTEPTNQILFCDGCDIAIHQGCYGVKDVPVDNWFCDPCTQRAKPEDHQCVVCPFKGGALKPVGDSWMHVACVLWLPEVGYGDTESMTDVANLHKINPGRIGLKCHVCSIRHGACIQCSEKKCCVAMHVLCGHSRGLLRMQTTPDDDIAMTQWCLDHAPPLPLELSVTPVSERTRAFECLENVGELDGPQRTSMRINETIAEVYAKVKDAALAKQRAALAAKQREHAEKQRADNPVKRRGSQTDHRGNRPTGNGINFSKRRKRTLAIGPGKAMSTSAALDGASPTGGREEMIERNQTVSKDEWDGPRVNHSDAIETFPSQPVLYDSPGDIVSSPVTGQSIFWRRVEPHFAPTDVAQLSHSLFENGLVPLNSVDNYVTRLCAGLREIPSGSSTVTLAEGHVQQERGGCFSSCLVDHIAASEPKSQPTGGDLCPLCCRAVADEGQLRPCPWCSTKGPVVGAISVYRQRSVICDFNIVPAEAKVSSQAQCAAAVQLQAADVAAMVSEQKLEMDNPSAHAPSSRASLVNSIADLSRECVDECLEIDRRLLDNSGEWIEIKSDRKTVLSILTAKFLQSLASLREKSAEAAVLFSHLLGDFGWSGSCFSAPLNIWSLTKLTSRLAQLAQAFQNPSARGALETQIPVPANAREANMNGFHIPMTAQIENALELSQIEREAAAVSTELTERCRENAALSSSLWSHILAARDETGAGAPAAVLGGASIRSVATIGDYTDLDHVITETTSIYHTRVNWHQVRGTLIRGMQDKSSDEFLGTSAVEDEDDDDDFCCICFDAESTEVNPIVFCDNCNIAVHKYCYGLPKVPDDDWFCMRCIPQQRRSREACSLCPISDGAMRKTTDGDWVHSYCAIWHTGISLRSATAAPQVQLPRGSHSGMASAAPSRHTATGRCELCQQSIGFLRRCANEDCGSSFHPLCAWYAGYFVNVFDSPRRQCEVDIQIFCPDCVPSKLCRDTAEQRVLRNAGRMLTKKRRGKKISIEEKARQDMLSRRRGAQDSLPPDNYPSGMCAVCFSSAPENGNFIIQCSGCTLSCHQSCYGVHELSQWGSKTWRCRLCEHSVGPVDCDLCPRTGGLLKPTTAGGWAHVACALWIPETHIKDPVAMEPIVAKVTKQRQNLKCSVCGLRDRGGCVQCDEKCYVAFHPLCAFFAGQKMQILEQKAGAIRFRAFCKKHTEEFALEVIRQEQLVLPPVFHELWARRAEFERLRMLIDHVKVAREIRIETSACISESLCIFVLRFRLARMQKRERAKREMARAKLLCIRQHILMRHWPPAEALSAGVTRVLLQEGDMSDDDAGLEVVWPVDERKSTWTGERRPR